MSRPILYPGTYTCTRAVDAHGWRAVCYGCHTVGPFAEDEGEAVDRAEDQGWRQYEGRLFCPHCRPNARDVIARREDTALVHEAIEDA